LTRRLRRPLLAVVALVLLAGCQIRTEVALDVAEDGSGTVTVSVGLDPDAAGRVPGLADELRVDDLEATGWTITGPAVEDDGFTWVRAAKPFATPEEAGAVLAELGQVAGADSPFREFAVTRSRSFARTEYGFQGTVDFSGGLEAFGDEALTEALDGEALGESVEAIEQRIGQAIDEVFSFRVAVGLPGSVESNAPTSAANGAVWEPRLSEGRAIELEATSEVVRTRSVVFAALAVVGAVGALTVGAIVPLRRARRRRAMAPRGRHGVAR
jgi:hypothetical protein